jgi:hypothetical protein
MSEVYSSGHVVLTISFASILIVPSPSVAQKEIPHTPVELVGFGLRIGVPATRHQHQLCLRDQLSILAREIGRRQDIVGAAEHHGRKSETVKVAPPVEVEYCLEAARLYLDIAELTRRCGLHLVEALGVRINPIRRIKQQRGVPGIGTRTQTFEQVAAQSKDSAAIRITQVVLA